MSKPFDVCIRGSGVVGRTLALLLARERLRVAIVTRPAPESSAAAPALHDVRAYALNSASRQLLASLRAWPEATGATPVQEMRVWGDDGGKLDFAAPPAPAGGPGNEPALAWIVDVPALEQQLAEAMRYQPQIDSVAEPVKAALTVVCEGGKSASRHEFGAAWTVKPYAQKALAARLQSDVPHQGVARQWFNNGEILALLPMGGAGGNSVALVWSVSVAHAGVLEKLSREEFAAALENACHAQAGEVGRLQLASELSSWPLALSGAERWVGPGWALAGDAAHTVHPLAGQGLNLGLADAAGLASVIHGREYWRGLGDEKLLRRYERSRKADIAAMSAVTDGLHGLFAPRDARLQALRNWGMNGFARSGPLKEWVARRAMG